MIEDIANAQVRHRLEFPLQFRWNWRIALSATIQLADEDGILAFAVIVARPKIELVIGGLAGLVEDQGLFGDDRLGFGQVKGNLPHQPIMDRKSTRLNSSHRCISYAVFCL